MIRARSCLILAVLLFLAMLSGGPSARAEEAPLVVATDEWPPYEFVRGGEVVGISTDVLYAVLERMGVRAAKPVQYPWKRGVQMLREGEVDILFSGVIDEKRLMFTRYPDEPLVTSRWVVLTRAVGGKHLQFTGLESFANRRVGIVIGYAYTPEINAWIDTAKDVDQAHSDEMLLRMLLNERVDYALCDALNCRAVARRMGLEDAYLEHFAPPLTETSIYPLFSRERISQGFVDRFGEQLRAFKATPAYQAILDRYLGNK